VVFHVLRTRDADAAAARYTAACGWAFEAPGPDGYRTFAWRAGGVAVGALAGVEHEPHVHPQWLYFFGVASVDAAAATARARGATLLPLGELGGRRFVVGDDPQGAAFGLMER
jgi:predicted enzyme related to lactoylglutathione lyase